MTAASSSPTARVLVLVGTDYHPFDRLVGWLDSWAATHPDVPVLVQFGTSTPPTVCRGSAYLDHDAMARAVQDADVVVCHGGPATISEARAAGHLPLVVPRDPTHGEHVDDHQVRFSSWLADKGLVRLCTGEQDLAEALGSTLAAGRGDGTRSDVTESVERFERLVEEARAGHDVRAAPVVLYVAGFGRSGSTLLERLLGESDGICALGEVVHLWERGVLADESCGCGERFSRCPFWTEVGAVAFGGWDPEHARRVLDLRDEVDRKRRIALTALPTTSPGLRHALAEHAAAYAAVYRAAAAVTGASVVVDSSKHVSLAFALSHDADLDLRVLHLVRDPRAVGYSWSREVRRPEVDDGHELMPQYSAATSAQRWTTTNLLVDGFRLRGRPVTRVRYEDLVTDPTGTLAEAAAALALPVVPDVTVTGSTVELGVTHSVAGNPMRFTRGPVTLRVDDAWRTEMPERSRRAIGLVTAPLRRWYGLPRTP